MAGSGLASPLSLKVGTERAHNLQAGLLTLIAPIIAIQIVLPLALMYAIVLTLSNTRARPRTVALCAINVLVFILGATYLGNHLPWQATWAIVWLTTAAAIVSIFIDTHAHPRQA